MCWNASWFDFLTAIIFGVSGQFSQICSDLEGLFPFWWCGFPWQKLVAKKCHTLSSSRELKEPYQHRDAIARVRGVKHDCTRMAEQGQVGKSSWLIVSNIVSFHPDTWGKYPIWLNFFPDGLKPPTRIGIQILLVNLKDFPRVIHASNLGWDSWHLGLEWFRGGWIYIWIAKWYILSAKLDWDF